MISSLSTNRFASHLGGLGEAPAGSTPLSNEIPAPVAGPHPLLIVGGIALITYFIVAAIKDGKSTGE